ncbi:MAG: DUF2232 domain-containing protein [bacterium]
MKKFFEILRAFFSSVPGKGLSSCVLLLSSFFAVFSATPAISTYVSEGRLKGFLVLLIGAVLCFVIGGVPAGSVYLFIILFSSVILSELIRANMSLGKIIIFSSLIIVGAYSIFFMVYANLHSQTIMDFLISKVNEAIAFMNTSYPDVIKQTLIETGMSEKEFASSIAIRFPGVMVVVIVVFLFVNTMMIAKNDEKLSSFLKFDNLMSFKMPEYFVWIALVFGSVYLYSTTQYNSSSLVEMAGLFLFKWVMAIYFLYGIMIAYTVISIKIPQGFFRALLFSVIIVFAYIAVAGLGFFDTWFDIRKYLNKKGEEI